MILYLDTSLLVAVLTAEADGGRVEEWLRSHSEALVVSDWVVTEFSAALSIKLRMKQIDVERRFAALASFSRLCVDNFSLLPVERRHFRGAATFAERYERGIKGGDALHLAVAFDHGATLCTLDRRLSEAGPSLGVATLLV